MALSRSTYHLHLTLLRHATGMVSAWRQWVKENSPDTTMDPDPIVYFTKTAQGTEGDPAKAASPDTASSASEQVNP